MPRLGTVSDTGVSADTGVSTSPTLRFGRSELAGAVGGVRSEGACRRQPRGGDDVRCEPLRGVVGDEGDDRAAEEVAETVVTGAEEPTERLEVGGRRAERGHDLTDALVLRGDVPQPPCR